MILKAEAGPVAQIKALPGRAKAADEAGKNEPQLDIPAEVARRLGADPRACAQRSIWIKALPDQGLAALEASPNIK